MSTGILETIKQVALEVFFSKNPVKVLYGKVISTNPIQVQIDENLILDQNFLSVQGTVSEGTDVTVMRCQGGQKYIVFGVRTIDDVTVNPNYGVYGSMVASGEWQFPFKGGYTKTSGYGYRLHPIYGDQRFHRGVDLVGVNKTIYPVNSGVVETVVHGYGGGYGNHVTINHGNGYWSLYAHMSFVAVTKGQAVDKNTMVGIEGSTGASTGSHLHLEIRKGANASSNTTDPMKFLSSH